MSKLEHPAVHALSVPALGLACAALAVLGGANALATPSTQIWIPSTDVQKFASLHVHDDVYARSERNPIVVLGPTVGLLPWNALQAEAGFDYILQGVKALDDHPWYFHGKLGTPEDGLFSWSPALAVAAYNIGTKQDLTNQDIGYALAARTFPLLGRLSAGYFLGNSRVLVDGKGAAANKGLLLSWDRTISELTDKLWLAVDYQGSRSALGALSFGAAWSFSPNVSLLAGWDHYLEAAVAGKDTFTVQVDITVSPFERAAAPPSSVP